MHHTMRRCIDRLVAPTSGSIKLNGTALVPQRHAELRPARRAPYSGTPPRVSVAGSRRRSSSARDRSVCSSATSMIDRPAW